MNIYNSVLGSVGYKYMLFKNASKFVENLTSFGSILHSKINLFNSSSTYSHMVMDRYSQ